MSRLPALLAASALLALGACSNSQPATNTDELKRMTDQLVSIEKDNLAANKEAAGATQSAVEEIRKLTARVEALDKSMATALTSQKRGAIFLPMEVETVCDNDALCNNTARAICNKINYPNGIPSKFTNGPRPVLNSVVCFD